MKVVTKTDEYVIYQKQSNRYAVRRRDKQWVNGDDKVRILLEHGLIDTASPKEPEVPAEEADAEQEADVNAEDTDSTAETDA